MARRASAAAYRRSPRYQAACARTHHLVDAPGMLPQPRLEDQIAVCLADRLPAAVVGRLGVRGVRAAARLVCLPARIVGLLVGVPARAKGSR
jgi:hypothetical protein